jgi:membrane protein DedA with SNARE-associated domain
MVAFTSDQWVILALVFVLGLLIGAFLLAGSGRRWKRRYREEVRDREAIEERHHEREREWDEREKEWRERDSLRGAAIKDKDRDGIDDRRE